jgi:uracil-DNA glycosylase family 4
MTRRGQLGEEILGHLRLYQDLGVQWVEKPSKERLTKQPPLRPKQSEAAPARPQANAARAAATNAPRTFVPSATMFDDLPGGEETLEQVRTDLGDCTRCKLAPTRRNIVFGSGNPRAELMFVGEAPGADEDAQGLPFVGRAGQLLTKIIEAIDLKREEVYICNILKCRPPDNRNPEPDEIAACEPFLFRQIASVKPRVICALGTFGAQTLLRTREPISRLRGYFMDYRGAKLLATFHPAYLLRNPNEKRKVWEDMKKIRAYLQSLREPGPTRE